MTNPNPAAPLTEAERAFILVVSRLVPDSMDELEAAIHFEFGRYLDAARATSTPAGLREAAERLFHLHGEPGSDAFQCNGRCSPIAALRAALQGADG
jgi:hypothetical protein